MNGRLLAQLGCVALADSEAVRDSYAWPRKLLTSEERAEAERLMVLARRLFYRAREAGCVDMGTDALFGEDPE